MSITGHVTIVNCDAPDCLEVEMIEMVQEPYWFWIWMDKDIRPELAKLGWCVDYPHHYCPKHAKTAACKAPAAVLK